VRVKKSSRRVRSLADEQLQKLVASLNSLHEGGVGVPLLMICGERAIRPLRDILLYREIDGFSIPRPQVVWALAELGARDVLLEYLDMEEDIADPIVRQAEDVVKNTAARALAAWGSEDVVSALLKKKQSI
jgi:HEAT repeat protein